MSDLEPGFESDHVVYDNQFISDLLINMTFGENLSERRHRLPIFQRVSRMDKYVHFSGPIFVYEIH